MIDLLCKLGWCPFQSPQGSVELGGQPLRELRHPRQYMSQWALRAINVTHLKAGPVCCMLTTRCELQYRPRAQIDLTSPDSASSPLILPGASLASRSALGGDGVAPS